MGTAASNPECFVMGARVPCAESPEEFGTYMWWVSLMCIGCFNVISLAFILLQKGWGRTAYERRLRRLGFIYCMVSSYRCAFPNHYVPRLVVVDAPFSNIGLVRSMAFIAEVSFATQIASAFQTLSNDFASLFCKRRA